MHIIKQIFFLLAAILIATGAGGCCAIFNGKTQAVTINSIPADAAVYHNGQYVGRTPLTIPFDRQREQSVELVRTGYQPEVKYFERRIDWWLLPLDFIIWPTVFVDVDSGAMYVFRESNCTLRLKPTSPGPAHSVPPQRPPTSQPAPIDNE